MESSEVPLEKLPALDRLRCHHGFVRRVPDIPLSVDKSVVLAALDETHSRARKVLGLADHVFITARQVHANQIALINSRQERDRCFETCDGLITTRPDVCLGIYVADCCAVYLVDRNARAVGLIHSGKRGTELGIVAKAIALLNEKLGIDPRDLVVQLSPCIRPPHYEVDFAAEIVRQSREAGVEEISDSGVCTACDLTRYYSYRAEKGCTGRMLALLALESPEG